MNWRSVAITGVLSALVSIWFLTSVYPGKLQEARFAGYDQGKASGYEQGFKAGRQAEKAPPKVQAFAEGICKGNAQALLDNTSPSGSLTEAQATNYAETYATRGLTCNVLRFIGSLEYGTASDYFFEIATGKNPLWYILTADATGVLNVQ